MSVELTEEQKLLILKEWNDRVENPPSLLELIRAAYPDDDFDGRTKEGRAVKGFLATRKIVAHGAHVYQPKDKVSLSEEHEEFITNNANMMTAVEIARIIFKDRKLSNLNQETRSVQEFIDTIDNKVIYSTSSEEVPADNKYKAPKTFHKMLQRINKYVHEGIDESKITPRQKQDIKALIGYVHTYRFLYQINHYENQTDRDLFESSFVRYCNDKQDLTQEEVDQYIVLSSEVVIAANIQRRKERLTNMLDAVVEDTDGRASMSLVEIIGKVETEYNQSVNRQNKLLEHLKQKRSDRLSKQVKENASILNLVQMWKDEESRKSMIHLAEMRKEIVKEEIEKLSSMDEIKCRILGLGEDEALNG
jgi:hypothetical protein